MPCRALPVVVALLAATGCAAADPGPQVPVFGPADVQAQPSTPAPVRVTIPAIHVVSGPLVALGLTESGELAVPPLDHPEVAGWWTGGARPGEPGPAVVVAHVSGRVRGASTPGLFARLHELHPGALVMVGRADGSTVTYQVTQVATYAKDRFPTELIYGDSPDAQLRLITCGGVFDPAARSYRSNVVAFATQVLP